MSNPSFEDYSICPNNVGQISYCNFWNSPSNDKPDYSNSCSNPSNVGVPYNSGGSSFQYAKSGEAYVSLYTYNGPGMNYREYISSQLEQSLTQNQCYYVHFFVSKIDWFSIATNNLALHFSSSSLNNITNNAVLNLVPHIQKFNNPIISDTMNWVKISGIYKANGGEQFITIGNFKNDSETDTSIAIGEIEYYGSMYYIDDVSVIAVSDLPNSMTAYAGEDVSVTLGDSIFIGQEISNLNCTWRLLDGTFIADSTSGIWVQPTEASTYVVEQNLCGVITFDTVTVFTHGVGLKEVSDTELQVFPNPSAGKIVVISNGELNMQLLDMMGKSVKHAVSKLSETVYEIDCSCENGLYQLILNENEKTIVKKIEFIK